MSRAPEVTKEKVSPLAKAREAVAAFVGSTGNGSLRRAEQAGVGKIKPLVAALGGMIALGSAGAVGYEFYDHTQGNHDRQQIAALAAHDKAIDAQNALLKIQNDELQQ